MAMDYSGYNTVGALPRTVRVKILRDETYEHVAIGICKPGHLLQRDSANKVLVHATLGIKPELLIAFEDVLQGRTIDDAYAVADPVQCLRLVSGDQVLLRVAAAAPAIAINDKLCAAADGTVKKRTGTVDVYTDAGAGVSTFVSEQYIVAVADVAVDNSAGATEVFVLATIH